MAIDGLRVESYSWAKLLTLRGKILHTQRGKRFRVTFPKRRYKTTQAEGVRFAAFWVERDGKFVRRPKFALEYQIEAVAKTVPTDRDELIESCINHSLQVDLAYYVYAMLIELKMTINLGSAGKVRDGSRKAPRNFRKTRPLAGRESKQLIPSALYNRTRRVVPSSRRAGSAGKGDSVNPVKRW